MNANHLRVFGYVAYQHLREQLRMKLDDKGGLIIHVGYHSTGGYKCNEKCISKFKNELMKEFEMIDIVLMTYFFGIEFHKSKKRLLMYQKRYALEILKNFEMEHFNATITPTELRQQLSKIEDEQDVNPTQYKRLIGFMCYLCNMRPAFSVGIMSRFMEKCSKKESVLALSSCETEYIAVSLCMCQVVWLMNLLKELDIDEGDTLTLMVDNAYAINLSKNPIAHGRSKHIEMRFYYLREIVSEGRLRLGYCRSENQLTDLLTKGVTIEVFKRLKMNMGMKDLEHLN
ncbi:uncharacterized protein LOC131598615 [Vicia villosa]|uniref:uncharacterized protein LOC131598615 n=1 Tax=Vicia villosa TaxID=3911 RepID=UPI00273B4644|nr:uncharacterized protein LOC131598615 [Vicia villosa]